MLYTGYTDEQDLGCDDEEKCRELYLKNKDAIQFVKMHMMPFTEGVEEARHFIQEATKDDRTSTTNIGDELDPMQEMEIIECQDGEDLFHPDFAHVNPDELEIGNNLTQIRKTVRNIELKTADEMLKEARDLDEFQKKALHIAIRYAQNVLIARKRNTPPPSAPFLMVHGGAGSGKSTLINVISQYVHELMMREGDDLPLYTFERLYWGCRLKHRRSNTSHTFLFQLRSGIYVT